MVPNYDGEEGGFIEMKAGDETMTMKPLSWKKVFQCVHMRASEQFSFIKGNVYNA